MSAAGRRVYDVLAEVACGEGTGTCFALLGDANMSFATRLADRGCRMIYVRHEHCAAAAAMAYARKSGEVGLATVTCGPGVTQLMTALPAAVRARLPMVIVAGEAPLGAGWYNQEIAQAPLVTATGAAYHSLHAPARMPAALRDAFLQARQERRPVVVGVPMDLQNQAWDSAAPLPAPSASLIARAAPLPPNPGDVTRAARLVDGQARVVVVAGLGAVEAGAGPACQALAARCGGLLATTLPARGLFHDDPFSIGIAGGFSSDIARTCLAEADLIVAVGCRLAKHTTDGGALWPQARVLHIDLDPAAMAQGQWVASEHLRADARLGVEALLAAITARRSGWRSDALAQQIAAAPADASPARPEPGGHDPRDVVAALDAALPQSWEMVNSSGHCSYYVAQMRGRPQRRFLTIREFGAIGNGLSFAMGVAAARPDDTVVLFDGDGSLLMHVQELETIRRHRLKILIVVLNDGAYGSEIHKLRAEGLSDAGAVFGRPDFAAIAQGFGLAGRSLNDLEAIPAAVGAVAASGQAAVWDVPVSDKVVSPVIRRAHPGAART